MVSTDKEYIHLHFDGEYYLDSGNVDKQKYEKIAVELLKRIWDRDGYYLFFNKKDFDVSVSDKAKIYNDWIIEETKNILLTPYIWRNMLYINTSASNVAIYFIAMHEGKPGKVIIQSLGDVPKWKKIVIELLRDIVVAFENRWIKKIVSKSGAVIRKDYDGDGLIIYGWDKEYSILCQHWPKR